MDQYYWAARPLDHKMKIRAVDFDEGGFRVRVVMSNTRSDVTLFKSAGDAQVSTMPADEPSGG